MVDIYDKRYIFELIRLVVTFIDRHRRNAYITTHYDILLLCQTINDRAISCPLTFQPQLWRITLAFKTLTISRMPTWSVRHKYYLMRDVNERTILPYLIALEVTPVPSILVREYGLRPQNRARSLSHRPVCARVAFRRVPSVCRATT